MAHLKEHVHFPANYSRGGAHPMRALLSTDIEGVRARGTMDIVITESNNITGSDYLREHWWTPADGQLHSLGFVDKDPTRLARSVELNLAAAAVQGGCLGLVGVGRSL
eukprot:scaffold56975_cov61-Attheya_sp.AAC.2